MGGCRLSVGGAWFSGRGPCAVRRAWPVAARGASGGGPAPFDRPVRRRLRARKKEQTRQRIAAVPLRLFSERGFDAVTVNQIAEAAAVAKATLFVYFRTKESLALRGVSGDDLAGIVARRPAEQTVSEALRAHYRAFAAEQRPDGGLDALLARVRVIQDSPALQNAVNGLLFQPRQALAQARP